MTSDGTGGSLGVDSGGVGSSGSEGVEGVDGVSGLEEPPMGGSSEDSGGSSG